ncbi:hypothetical protein QZH41_010641 [Actinostola sp. cb2023]|nr:hypothetical protein QZH41_010641 [Actinostola sp. cb2023]
MSRDVLIAVKEERTRIGNVCFTKQTALIATDDGGSVKPYDRASLVNKANLKEDYIFIISLQSDRLRVSRRSISFLSCVKLRVVLVYRGYGSSALPGISRREPEMKRCCDSDSDFPWYDLLGKGCFMVMVLILLYIIVGAISLPFPILYFLLYCVCKPFNKDEDSLQNRRSPLGEKRCKPLNKDEDSLQNRRSPLGEKRRRRNGVRTKKKKKNNFRPR